LYNERSSEIKNTSKEEEEEREENNSQLNK